MADRLAEVCYCSFFTGHLSLEEWMKKQVRRREFIALLGGTAAAWPVAVGAQEVKRVGVLMNGAATDPAGQSNLTKAERQVRDLRGAPLRR